MTICVPKNPFVIAWNVFKAFCIVSWIPYIILCVIWYEPSKGVILGGWGAMWVPLLHSLELLREQNEKKHWIQWCDKSKKQECAE